MLVLTRRTNQSIVIGSNVTITIVEIRGEQVRLGISAPRDVSVYREEVLEQIRAQNRRAAELDGGDTTMLPRRGGRPVEQPERAPVAAIAERAPAAAVAGPAKPQPARGKR